MGGLISEEYKELLKVQHVIKDFGRGGIKSAPLIKDLMRQLNTKKVLDYGCGKGTLTDMLPEVQRYDPAIPQFSAPPAGADLVVCRDVMEHVEEDMIDAVLDDIKRLARKAAWFQIVFGPSGEWLADGRNTHISVHPIDWWTEKLKQRWPVVHVTQTRPKDAQFLCKPG